ncbi:PEBP-like protein, partial [Aspergillus heteromorphus CBS 117.55]
MPTSKNVERAMTLLENDPLRTLGLTFNNKRVDPGQYLAKNDAASHPELSFPQLNPKATYLVVSLDLDAPFVSFRALSPILHWIQHGLKPVRTEEGGFKLTINEPFVANYIGPAPPPGAAPHRYVFFLYEEPVGFDGKRFAPPNGKNMGSWARMRYDLDAWGQKTGLGPVIAVNYFVS